ncbi:sarcosine dehydrogenase, mitochondrial [Diorhabda carinulata]|uniref:sarcosine dehydrogenase, mitochondrial n=1 Tax=Diorhabda carinulata TaxID=1163345 RepID=UPI0025A1C121|nr:sarcosine dehydrogenase, mitochondrial [Diorhabda carinulata]
MCVCNNTMLRINKVCGIVRSQTKTGNLKKQYFSNKVDLPKQADVVVVGGGVIGCSALYHLTKRGVNAVLLEKHKITSGTTWHSGALVWSLRATDVDDIMLKKTRDLLASLEEETGINPGWIQNGGIFIARTAERLEEYKRLHTLGHLLNLESHIISPTEAQKLSPILEPKSFYGALWSPNDGYCDPSMYCSALLKGAKNRGGKVFEDTPVTKILTVPTPNNEKKIVGIETPVGTIKTNVIVNAAGVWSRKLTQMVGLDIPLTPMKHAFVVTGSIPEAKGTPSIRDHDGCLYFRPQGDSILFGGYEPNPVVLKDLPEEKFHLYELDMAIFDQHWKKAVELCPSFEKAGIKSDICGPESFTPDHKPIMGEDPKCVGLFHANAFNSLGVQLSGGAGEQIASWITLGRPDLPLFAYDIRRYTPVQRQDRAWVLERSHEGYAKTYGIIYPHDQPLAGRNHRIDQFHEALVANGAVMEEALGWERPAYFIKDRTAPVRSYDWYGYYDHVDNEDKRYENELEGELTFGFPKSHDLVREEALAARNNVALFDLTCYAKMYLAGPDAEEAADWLFTANVDRKPGSIIYTCSLNSRGYVEADVTVIPLEEGVGTLVGPVLKGKGYYIVAGAKSGYQTKSHFRKQLYKKNFKSLVTEMTNRIGILSIQGPKSNELLQSMTEFPITNEQLPHGLSKLIKINGHTCRVLRISYIGELGYEIHIPLASCIPVYNKLMEAGRGFDLKHAGFRALDCLSCEKGYHLLNYDLRIDDNPIEAGLGRFCRKDGQYLGKQAVEKFKQQGVAKRRVFFTLQDPVALYGYETIWRDDVIVGILRRGDYGFSLDSSIGIGYVQHPNGKVIDDEYLKSGTYQIEVRNKKYPATLFLKSPFDPQNLRVKGQYEHQFEEQTHFED